MFRSLRRRLARLGRWPRFCAAGLCVLLAVTSAVGAHRNAVAAGASTPVVVAVRALPAGHVLTARDVAARQWPARLRPGAARASPRDVVGRRLAGPVAAREPITALRLLGHDLTTGLGTDAVATPITVDDAHLADLVQAGDRVDVLATPPPADEPGGTESADVTVVASRAVVLAVLSSSTGNLGEGGTELIVAVPRDTATRIARLRSSRLIAVFGDPP